MSRQNSRREFLRAMGLSAAVAPFVMNRPSLAFPASAARKQRLIIIFTPNGVVPPTFWPDEEGADFKFKSSLEPLEPFRDKTLILHGVNDAVRGDGDSHMRGMGCLLTGIELFPGNVQGGGDTPAGWASGLSIDQEIKRYLQQNEATRTRFGSLEFGVMVPQRADTWTRMVYAGPNKPIAPIDNPYQMFEKLYGEMKDRENMVSVLDELREDLAAVRQMVSAEDRQLLEQQETFVREFEQSLKSSEESRAEDHAEPELPPGIDRTNDQMPELTRMQTELLVHSMANDFTRVATFQFTNSVGGARMGWLGIEEGHHALSHEPDSNTEAMEKLTKINRWFCEQLAHLAKRLDETPEPGGEGSLLDNTLIVWTNELGKGSSHTHNNTPFVLVGGGLDFKMGRSLKMGGVPHNRLLMSLAAGFGYQLDSFGNPDYCGAGPLALG
ncbi:DUF1552 domain-containing protein [Aeoliella mucimassa]|uniref:DUF1552 domain-containing protein n=1 Tax=Aeoliella mucimassa TaxID=2527972 RepID=A0A518AGY9_9BACT|nr:DUF1552 domain-containing protein [Aeoliella mucimassa]QDU54000.1 hypothetical protein Pan181_01800 [Aeoliella mucimassa]